MSINRQSAKRRRLQTKDLPPEPGAVGIYSPFGFLWGCLFAIVPVAYVYIVFILLRELSVLWPAFATFVETYVPLLASLLLKMQQKTPSSTLVELWCILEAMFYVWLKCHIRYLEHRDPLEQSLSSAPFMTLDERALLWKRMMILERDDPASLITGWFFDQPLENISRYDVREFVTWCMFEGRNQEHLTSTELEQLDDFVRQLEYHISIQYYGIQSEGEDEGSVGSSHQTEQEEIIDGGNTTADATAEEKLQLTARGLPQPKKCTLLFMSCYDKLREIANTQFSIFFCQGTTLPKWNHILPTISFPIYMRVIANLTKNTGPNWRNDRPIFILWRI